MRRLPINPTDLEMAMMPRPTEHGEGEEFTYLDVQTGELVSVWDDDEAFAATMNEHPDVNVRNRERVEADPERYIDVPRLDESDTHEILREFLDSSWTDDEERWSRAHRAYSGSIGRWKRAMRDYDETIIHAWHRYEEEKMQRQMLEFLAEHGIEPMDAKETKR
jgi:hypothetical protein